MHLKSMRLKSFRSCDDTIVGFHEDLTILAGENNAGKTNVLDAIRLLTSPTDGRRARFAEPDDIRRGGAASFELEAEFGALSDAQRGAFIGALRGPVEDAAIYGLTYDAPAHGARRGTLNRWVGARRGPDPEPQARELIRHVHLPALRDATRELASSTPGRIEFLLKQSASAPDQQDLLRTAKSAFDTVGSHGVIMGAQASIAQSFKLLTEGVQPHEATLGFTDPTLQALARDLRFRLALAGFDPSDLSEVGLGYANLLFLSSVLVELRSARDAELTLFLVEEPEAHLHPQLQAATLHYLRDQAALSRDEARGPGEHDGRIQVVVSTHSPNLTAGASIEHVVVLRSVVSRAIASEAAPGLATPAAAERPISRAISIADLGMPDEVVKKIDRYLDVTRSALLFSRRVMLVEGIAEALLVPVFARILFKESPSFLARFRSATLVPIDGVDFEPYVRLLLTKARGHGTSLSDRIVVVTDEDPDTNGEDRPERLRKIAAGLGSADGLSVLQTPITLEAALLESSGPDVLKAAYLEQHPLSQPKWTAAMTAPTPAEKGAALVQLMASSRTRKGDLAQTLSRLLLERSQPNDVPRTFQDALRRLVDDA